MKKIFLSLFLLFFVSYGVFLFLQPKTGTAVGQKIPSIEFYSITGEKVSTESLKGKKILINFTATWCPYCNAEKEVFQKEYRKIEQDNNLEVLVVFGDFGAEDKKDNIPKVLEYLKEHNYTFPTYFDSNRYLIDLFKVKTLPTSILVNEKGVILEIGKEFHTLEKLNR